MGIWPQRLPPFLWGAATSSHQIEGFTDNDWTRWEKAGHIQDHTQSGRSTDHFRNPDPDLKLFRELGWNAYRLSLEWSRIEPAPGQFSATAMAQYRHMLCTIKALGMEPMVTLHHFTLPTWFADQGGFFARDAKARFLAYVSHVVAELRDLVTLWITINEPMVYAVRSYGQGVWPPGGRNLLKARRVAGRLADLHRQSYQRIKEISPQAMVGLAHHLVWFEPFNAHSWTDRLLSQLVATEFNWRFIDRVATYQDFFGLNYYTRQWIKTFRGLEPLSAKPGAAVTDMGWEMYPEGLYRLLMQASRYQKPILITENGLATLDDTIRQKFLVDHLDAVARAQSDGAEIRGYLHWAALDNFEWAEGYRPRFGLIAVDYESLERTPRATAFLYRNIIAANQNRTEPIIVPRAPR